MNALRLLREQGYSELACQFAGYIARQQANENPLVTLTAGLLSEAVSEGHVCLNLHGERPYPAAIGEVLPTAQQWIGALAESDVVGAPGEFSPLVLSSEGLLYLYRYWQDEQQVARAIVERLCDVSPAHALPALQHFFTQWRSEIDGVDWQKIAVLAAMQRQLCVISGGPGTGKTTVVLQLLRCLASLESERADDVKQLRIALAAPTGKAAARLQQAIGTTDSRYRTSTLHRLLGISTRHEQGRYSPDRPLPLDVLIIDEASMIDISLMALTLRALPVHARLILIGDSEQLASVESGAVLASLCADEASFSAEFAALARHAAAQPLVPSPQATPLQDSLVRLRHSYRFASGGLIGQLAEAVKAGDCAAVEALLRANDALHAPSPQAVQDRLLAGYQSYIDAVEAQRDPETCLQAFERFRILCAQKQGGLSVASVNAQMQALLSRRGWRSQRPFYAGRPVMITCNDYRLNLFNGDIGLVLPDERGELQCCFAGQGELRRLPLSRLPAHETVFAMTVHKSQGSEFDTACLLLPQDDGPLLNRELVYTAVTRARESVSVLADGALLQRAVTRRHQRESGLDGLLCQ